MLPLVYHPDDRLTTPVTPVDSVTAELTELIEEMIATMREEHGIGLAGPQIGRMGRFFVVQVPGDQARAFINPQIVAISPDESMYEEGCLSIPGVYAEVRRPSVITVEAIDETGSPFRLDAHGLLARVIQHENDHLDGVLFFDHLSRRKRERLLKNYHSPNEAD